MRVLVIGTLLVEEHSALWRELAQRDDLEILMVGTSRWPHSLFPVRIEPPSGLETMLLQPFIIRNKGALWWFYRGLPGVISEFRPDVIHVLSEAWGLLAIQARRHTQRLVVHGADDTWVHGGRLERTVRLAVARAMLRHVRGYVSWNSRGLGLAIQHNRARYPVWARVARRHGQPAGAGRHRQEGTEFLGAVVPAALPDIERLRQRELAEVCGGGALSEVVAGPPYLLYAGRLSGQKGVSDLLSAWKTVQHETSMMLRILGSGAAGTRFRKQAEGMRRVVFHEAVEMREMGYWLREAEAVIVPSRKEPISEQFGLVALEAGLLGTPVLVSDSGSLPSIVGCFDVVFEASNPMSLVDRLRWFLALNEEARTRLGLQLQGVMLERFDPVKLADRLEYLWRTAMR